MFNWDDCPLKLFDQYIEVEDVRLSDVQSEELAFVEVWISSFFNCKKADDCKEPVRRPIYGVVKQIKKLCGTKGAMIAVMCDEGSVDTSEWGVAVCLLLEQLKEEGLLKYSILFTKKNEAEIEAIKTKRWQTERNRELFCALTDMLDVTVYQRANVNADGSRSSIVPKDPQIPSVIKDYLNV